MKIQILWVMPAERRFGSGDILTAEQQAEFGLDAKFLIAAGEAQLIAPAAETTKIERANKPRLSKQTRKES